MSNFTEKVHERITVDLHKNTVGGVEILVDLLSMMGWSVYYDLIEQLKEF